MTIKRYLSYDNMHGMLNSVYRQMAVNSYRPDIVVGLVRGGMIPAVHVSHYFDVPMVAFKYSLRDHPGSDDMSKFFELMRTHARILVVDDICDEGHTLYELMKKIEADSIFGKQSWKIKTAVLQHNLGAKLFTPDYAGEEINKLEKPEWIVYPWEYE
jgi:hypoxanthine phosphoribosyltransferase